MFEVQRSEPVYEGRVIELRRDTVAMPGGGTMHIQTEVCTLDAEGAAPVGMAPGVAVVTADMDQS